MDRRTFMSWVGLGFVASSLPVAIAACTSDSPTSQETTSPAADTPPPPPPDATATARTDGFVEVGTLADLDASGSILDKDFKPEALVVFRDPNNNDQLIALNARCPHAGCAAEWNTDEQLLVCPCHKSKFKADGAVNSGPAEAPLTPYQIKVEGETILVKA